MTLSLDVEHAVNDRYSLAAHQREAQLCCPIEYDSKFLDVIPKEIKEKDYGCGDPTPFVRQDDSARSRFRHSRNERASGCSSLIAVMQSTYLRQLITRSNSGS